MADTSDSGRASAGESAPVLAERSTNRIDGVDLARGLALIGMFIAHVAPAASTLEAAALLGIADERPRLLFALCAGIGLGLLSGGSRPVQPDGRGRLRRQIAIRAGILIALGVLIVATLKPLVFVILDVYGVAFLLMIPLLFLPARAALIAGVVSLFVLPGLAAWAAATPSIQAVRATGLQFAVDWFVTGAYPLVIWVPVMLIGLALARFGIGSPRVVVFAAVTGGLAVVLLPVSSALPSADLVAPVGAAVWPVALGVSLQTVANTGVGLVVVAAAVALLGLTAPVVRRVAGAICSPVTAMGAMPLSVYTLHLIAIALAIRVENGVPTDDSWALTIGLIVGAMFFAWTWRRFIGRGPLEMVLRFASGRDRADAAPAADTQSSVEPERPPAR